jgi:ribosomal protein S21
LVLQVRYLHDKIPDGPTRCVSSGRGEQMAFVTIRDGEPPEGIVSRFRAAVTRGGILKEHKDRRFFRSKGEKERLAARRSARRRRRVTAR